MSRAKTPISSNAEWVTAPHPDEEYELVLYISGATERSRSALANIKSVAERHLTGRYRLAVVDVFQQPERARGDQIIAAPTLVKRLPLPLRQLVGDLASEERVMVGLDLVPAQSAGKTHK